jgi:integrase
VPEESRLPYDIADLQKIFSSPVYTEGVRPVGGAGEAAFWLPLLGLWTGCRLEELGQALVADVQAADGVHYLNISDLGEGKSVKTAGSRRPVPIHPDLIRLGFLRYIQDRRKQGDARVFPLLKKNSHGRWTQNWSKWWRTYARGTVGIADPRKVFHSFRHTFIRACREFGIEEEQRIAITGRAGGTVGRAYGGAYPLPAPRGGDEAPAVRRAGLVGSEEELSRLVVLLLACPVGAKVDFDRVNVIAD